MSTPMFKVLAQSLRLGQPPDPTSALRVLVEVAEKQQAEIDDLRAKLTIATSRLQYAEARLARMADAGAAGGHDAPPSARPADGGRPSAGTPAPGAADHVAVAHPPLAIPGAPIPAPPRAAEIPMASAPLVDTGLDDFNQTLVIDKRDVESVAGKEAPFPLAPAAERPRASARAGGTPFQGSDEEATRRAPRSVPPPPPPAADRADDVAGLASEALSFEGEVTVTEQMSRSQMSRAALGGDPRRSDRDGDPE